MENIKNTSYPYSVSEWNKLDAEIKKSETLYLNSKLES